MEALRKCADMVTVMDMGRHMVPKVPGLHLVIQLLIPGLEERCRLFPALNSFVHTPGPPQLPLPSAITHPCQFTMKLRSCKVLEYQACFAVHTTAAHDSSNSNMAGQPEIHPQSRCFYSLLQGRPFSSMTAFTAAHADECKGSHAQLIPSMMQAEMASQTGIDKFDGAGYFDAPSASACPLRRTLAVLLPPVTMVFCSIESLAVMKVALHQLQPMCNMWSPCDAAQ